MRQRKPRIESSEHLQKRSDWRARHPHIEAEDLELFSGLPTQKCPTLISHRFSYRARGDRCLISSLKCRERAELGTYLPAASETSTCKVIKETHVFSFSSNGVVSYNKLSRRCSSVLGNFVASLTAFGLPEFLDVMQAESHTPVKL